MSLFTIHHITKYQYDRPVKESSNQIKIFPFSCAEQEVLQHDLTITSNPDIQVFTDYWGNKIGLFNVLAPHKEMVIESKLVIRTMLSAQLNISFQTSWENLESEVSGNLQLLELSSAPHINAQSKITQIIAQLNVQEKSIADVVEACGQFIYKQFKYIKGITNIETTVDEILEVNAGVCQDFAHLMLQILRTLKIPSRYVSGYICPNKNGMRGEGATHAWVEAYIPGYGWAGIDPTNNAWVAGNHIKLAVGKNFYECSPVKGTFKGPARQTLSVFVSVGYEDGHIFEEVNNVKMEAISSTAKQKLLDDDYDQQQQ